MMRVGCMVVVALSACLLSAHGAYADELKDLVDAAVKAAGGAEKIPKIFRWEETYFVGQDPAAKGTRRDAILVPPNAWYESGRNIAVGNPDRAEKTYLVWVWTLAPLLDPDSKLTSLPGAKHDGKPIEGIRITREKQKDIDIYFFTEGKQLARIDWRDYQIDFADWKEADGFKYPAKAFVRYKNGKLHLRTEFQVLEVLKELPKNVQK